MNPFNDPRFNPPPLDALPKRRIRETVSLMMSIRKNGSQLLPPRKLSLGLSLAKRGLIVLEVHDFGGVAMLPPLELDDFDGLEGGEECSV